MFYVLCAIFHFTLFFIMLHELTHFTFNVSIPRLPFPTPRAISLKVIPTSVLAHFGPYHTHFGPKIWVRSGHGPKWVGTEVYSIARLAYDGPRKLAAKNTENYTMLGYCSHYS